MDDRPVLICYDDSDAARRAIDVAATILGPRRAVVLDVGPYVTPAESIALASSVVPGAAFNPRDFPIGVVIGTRKGRWRVERRGGRR